MGFSPFYYNETVVQEYFPLNESEAKEQGFGWQKEEVKKYNPTMKSNAIPDSIAEVSDAIIQEVIECAHKGECSDQCATAFKITQNELDLYRRLQLPLPTLCFNCRHGERIAKRNPRKLFKRITADGVEVETTYAPDRKEKILSEAGYQQAVE